MPTKVPFRVIHVSGQDDNHKAIELNTHSPVTQGWHSSRFCLYPQDIVVQLENRVRLRKIQILSHQFLIATKIEFYVGDVPEGIPPSLQNARYRRLGYVALSDNEKTGYKARELKSVHVDAEGLFVKFVIHKNHINKHNLYNQVGIVAINVIGDEPDAAYPVPDIKDVEADLGGLHNRPDYISPLDDLAFDMYQDPEVAQIIRKLEHKKQEAVLQERYDYAKKLKSVIQDLQKVGEKLGKYEVEKRQAVENEDYDKAKLKKVQMDEYRLQVYKQLDLYDLLELSGSRHPQPIDLEPKRQPTPAKLTEISNTAPPERPKSQTPGPRTPYDERPLPAIKNKNNPPETPIERPPPRTPADERPLPANKVLGTEDDDDTQDAGDEPSASGNVTGEPEPMIEQDQREAGVVIETFGLPLASKAYSKTWSFREDALLEVYKQLSELPPSAPREDSRAMLRAAVFLANRALKDKVFAVYTAAINLLKLLFSEFIPSHKIPKGETSFAVERVLPTLLQKSGDTAARNRDAAKAFIVDSSKYDDVKPLHVVPAECVKPFKLSIAPRLALSRVELVDTLYKEHGLQNSGLTVDNLMRFCCQALQHTAGEVREGAERIIISLYKENGAPVKDFLPADTDKTRKNVLYKQLYEAFDRIDGKPSKDQLKKQKQDSELAKQQEIEQLQEQLQALKDMAAGKAPVDVKEDPLTARTKEKKERKPRPRVPPSSSRPDQKKDKQDDNASVYHIEHTCIFCGEKNETFTEEGLDLHYWKSCPMLKRCSNCKQVVEISGLTDHLLTECEAKEGYKKCPRCTEAITAPEHDKHVADKTCNSSEAKKNHCPLCHQNPPAGEDGWKNHLMGRDGCAKNPRRTQALGKQGKGATGSKPTGKGTTAPAKAPTNAAKGTQGRTPRR